MDAFVILFVILLLFIIFGKSVREDFYQPWWQSTRNTRNMSYDLRGDIPIFDYRTDFIWNQSPHYPIINMPP